MLKILPILTMKWKIWRIESSLKAMLRDAGMEPLVWSFGAYHIDPKHMVFVVGVRSDRERDVLRKDLAFPPRLKELLVKINWPVPARSAVQFDIESQETVDRETRGNWWYHYK